AALVCPAKKRMHDGTIADAKSLGTIDSVITALVESCQRKTHRELLNLASIKERRGVLTNDMKVM
ncbi:MAG: hypothetical protein AAF546_14535, partial [Verrucomicrobiota bacterium]